MANEQDRSIDQLAERVTKLEILLTHLERRVQELHDVLLETSRRHDEFERAMRRLADRQRELDDRLVEPRDPAAEKPPHY
jgi:uncharacterized coiled-coil protein SlyX